MNKLKIPLLIVFLVNSSVAFSEENIAEATSHKEHASTEKPEKRADHKKSEKDEDHADHQKKEHDEDHANHQEKEHAEENSNVGPDKGIVKANEEEGFILSPEASKNFEIKTIKLIGAGPWMVPVSARMLSKEEVNLYRIRNGFIKRIDFKLIAKNGSLIKIMSSDLVSGDEIITNGVGFVRIAELTAFGGAPEGHSH